ncbi:hypothetical protein I4U23_029950 [Adineta vaga]|nr:hypothetical protein I4U23_029950 [Adineta vaga]
MRSRYNLRIQSSKPLFATTNKKSSRITKNSKLHHANSSTNRRQSLRLKPIVNKIKLRTIKHEINNKKLNDKHLCQKPNWRQIETKDEDETLEMNDAMDDDDYDDEVLIRHHRLMLEERKDRKLYERYIRDQRTLRRLQCRRTHSAHLKEATRNRLLRELERERRYTIHDKICAHHSNQAMNWTSLETKILPNRTTGTIHELDVMIDNLKKVNHHGKSSISKPRLSVRERQNQRLKTSVSKSKDIHSPSTISQTPLTFPTQLTIISQSPRVPIVASNSQRLTCIQNVLSHQSNNNNPHPNRHITNDTVSPLTSRKSFLRPKSTNSNVLDLSATKRRPLEKENCSIVSNSPSHSNLVLRTAPSPYVTAADPTTYRSSLFSIEWYRSNIPRLLRRLVPIQIRENIQ